MIYKLLADFVFIAHLAFVLFIVLGGIAVWRVPKLAWLHLPAVAWGALIEFAGWICPLTPWEQSLRRLAGEKGYSGGFVEHYLFPVLYPEGLTREVQIVLGVLVLAINAIAYALIYRRRLHMRNVESNRQLQWSVASEQRIAAPAQEVWDAISMRGNLELCHPFCERNPVHVWPGPDSLDEVHYLSGWVYERRFLRWYEGVGYDLEIGRRGGGTSFVSWRITPVDQDSCVLSITVYPHVLKSWPAVLRWIPYTLRVRPMLKQYLESVVRGFEWYVVRGEPVPRNQFGRHPWFSAP